MKLSLLLSLVFTSLLFVSCNENTLVFPTLKPAQVRIINTSQDVQTLEIVVDGANSIFATRGEASPFTSSPAGRPVGFVLKENGEDLRRDTLFYTLGGEAKVLLFARGSTNNIVEFRRAIQDTTLSASANPVIRFTHMAENTDVFVTMEVFIKGGEKLFEDEFDPGLSSAYRELPPGTYSFELREYGTTNVAATLENVVLSPGTAYMLYAWDTNPPALDQVALSVF